MGRIAAALTRVEDAFFNPAKLPEGTTLAVALLPCVAAGLVFFRDYATEALGLAVLFGVMLALTAWRLRLGAGIQPIVSALIAVALLGAGAPIEWIAIAAALGAVLEVVRRRWVPGLRLQAGLVAALGVLVASRGEAAAYLNPVRLRPLVEPVRLWSDFYGGGSAAPIDPVRLYVGNVPGPMFATSLLAVVVAAAWLWYARRLSLVVVVCFAAGAVIPIALWRWNPGYHLDSGPTWFVVALLLADRASLPESRASRPLLGFAAGVAGIGLRRQGFGIEAVYAAVAGLQVAVAAVEGAEWLIVHRSRVARRVRALRRVAGPLRSDRTAA